MCSVLSIYRQIGYERRSSDRPAGIRTMALVSLGSALFTINSTFGFLSGPMVSGYYAVHNASYQKNMMILSLTQSPEH